MNALNPSLTFVCTANMCRSPIAELVFRREFESWLRDLGLTIQISSRGTHAQSGEFRCEVASARFEADSTEVSALFAVDDPATQGLILTMEQQHVRFLVQSFPKLRTRIFSLAQAVEILSKIFDGIVDRSLFTSPDPEISKGFVAPPLPTLPVDRWQWLVAELDANRGLISTTNSILTSGDFDIGDAHVPDGPTHELSLELVSENARQLGNLIVQIIRYSEVGEHVQANQSV